MFLSNMTICIEGLALLSKKKSNLALMNEDKLVC